MTDPSDSTMALGGSRRGPRERLFGHFRVLRLLGRGGQGEVHEAVDERLDRHVALKVLSLQGLEFDRETDGKLRARFEREAAVAARLEHPFICSVYEFGESEGQLWIAMQLVEGTTLQQLIRDARTAQAGGAAVGSVAIAEVGDAADETITTRPGRTASASATRREPRSRSRSRSPVTPEFESLLVFFEKAAKALHAAHLQGLVHRDFKPGNVMVTRTGDPVVLDFGLAADAMGGGTVLTLSGDQMGTPAYMAPEQVLGKRSAIDRRTDVYALGISLYECLTLRRPFEQPTRDSLFHAILNASPERPSLLNPAISLDLEAVLDCALDKDPNRRYASAEAFADDLAAVRDGRPVSVRRLGRLGRTLRWARRNRVAAALIIVLAIGTPTLGVLGGVLLARLPDIRAQEEARNFDFVEAELERGFFELHHGSAEVAAGHFRAGLNVLPTSIEARAGLADACLRTDRREEAGRLLASLADHPDSAALDGLRRLLDGDSELRPPVMPSKDSAAHFTTAVGWFMMGSDALRIGHAAVKGGRAESGRPYFRSAEACLRRAVVTSPRPRRAFYALLADAISHLTDGHDDPTWIVDALQSRWPESHTTWWWSAALLPEAESAPAWRRFLEFQPENGLAWYNLGNAISSAAHKRSPLDGRNDGLREAAFCYRKSLERQGDEVDALVNLAKVLIELGELDEAGDLLDRALAMKADHFLAQVSRSDVLERKSGKTAALDWISERLTSRPDDHRLRELQILTLQDMGDPNRTLAAAEELVRRAPSSALGYWMAARMLNALGRNEEALKLSLEGTRKAPREVEIYAELAHAARRCGQLALSECAARDALAIAPDFANAHLYLAETLMEVKRFEDALPHAQAFLAQAEDRAENHLFLARVAMGCGRRDLVDAAVQKALVLEPDAIPARKLQVGMLVEQGRHEEAEKVWTDLALRQPQNPWVEEALAHYYMAARRIPESIAAWQRAIELKPDQAEFHCNLHGCLRGVGRREDAARAARRGHELGIKRPDWRYPSADWLLKAVTAWADDLASGGSVDRALAILEEHATSFPEIAGFAEKAAKLRAAAR